MNKISLIFTLLIFSSCIKKIENEIIYLAVPSKKVKKDKYKNGLKTRRGATESQSLDYCNKKKIELQVNEFNLDKFLKFYKKINNSYYRMGCRLYLDFCKYRKVHNCFGQIYIKDSKKYFMYYPNKEKLYELPNVKIVETEKFP